MPHKSTPEDDDDKGAHSKSLGFYEKMVIIFTNITVEPMLVLYLLPSVMSSITTQNLNLEKACRVNLRLNQSICDGLAARDSSMYEESDEIMVQKYVASMYAWKNVIQSVLPAMLLLFMGSWSDRKGRRKPFIIIPIFGELVSVILLILCTYFFDQIPVQYVIMAEAIPPSITGGWFAMFMGVYSYIGGISSLETRTVRMGALSMFMNVSHLIGISCSGVLYVAIGFYGVFGIALGMYVVGIIYGLIVIHDKPVEKSKEHGEGKNSKSFCADFFDLKHIKETFKVALSGGESNRRKRICVILILVMVIIGPLHGEFTVLYLFVRYKFQWNEVDYSIYLTFSSILHTLSTIFSITYLSNHLKMDDALLGMISSTGKVVAAFVFAFAPNSTIFYLGASIEMINSTAFIAMRSIISKLVSPDQHGKINSLFGVSEALMPLVYGPIYSLMYKWMIDFLPGGFFLFGGIFTMPAVGIFYWLYKQHMNDKKLLKQRESQELLSKKRENTTKHTSGKIEEKI